MRLFEIQSSKIAGTALPMILYHGSDTKISKFRRSPSGVFFSPHKEWARHYGNVVIPVYVWAPKVHLLDYKNPDDKEILDSLFDRDYITLAQKIKELEKAGYYALQTRSDSEMVCVFSKARIYSAKTGAEM